jgi:uncharacterized Zn-finger protein
VKEIIMLFYRSNFLPRTYTADKVQSPETGSPLSAELFELGAEELPAVCPNADMPLWASHPRVFLDVVNENEVMCPYCGTRYRLRAGTRVHDHQFGARSLHQHRKWGVEAENPAPGRSQSCSGKQPELQNLSADAFGNTTLELMTRWLRKGRA